MKRIIQYIFIVWVGLIVSCQPAELIDQEHVLLPGEVPYGKATFVMSAVIPDFGPKTKAMGKDADINSFHLVVFDEKGMFVELAEAEFIGDPYQVETPSTGNSGTGSGDVNDGTGENDGTETVDETDEEGNSNGNGTSSNTPALPERPNMDSDYVRKFKVVLTLTDKPRIIHFIANCPVNQIAYGHEASIISNLHVDNGTTAYWSRAEVPHIMVEDQVYGEDQTVHRHPCEHLIRHLEYVHLLRNFAQIVVRDGTAESGDNFRLIGFSIYNTINIGTVAPYNNKKQEFQCFVDWEEDADGNLTGSGHTHTYEELLSNHFYEGHALASAVLNQELPKNGTEYIWYNENNPFFMYERKVSVKTDEEEKWRESPPHVIIWAKYKESANAAERDTYYKFDLVYNVMTSTESGSNSGTGTSSGSGNGTNTGTGTDSSSSAKVSEIKYYNILRNFLYDFSITNVSGPGYDTPEAAIKGVASNNLAGSTTTSKFTEVGLDDGEIAVSYTDTTLVNSGTINFKYRYIREENGTKTVLNNAPSVTLLNTEGEVISDCEIETTDIQSGPWAGYRDVTLTIKEPDNTTHEQTIVVKTENPMLSRRVHFYLKKKLNMQVECLPRIFSGVAVDQEIKIKLPKGLTEDMFPLTLAIEVRGLTLSPNATKNTIPVETGKSIVPGRESQNSFYYTYTINTYEEYLNPDAGSKIAKDEDDNRVITTDWITNIIDNASTVYVANKYFNTANANWINVAYAFPSAKVRETSIPKGLDRDVSIEFTMDNGDNANNGNVGWNNRTVTVNLDSLKTSTGASTLTIPLNNPPSGVTVNNNRTVTVTGLKTTGKTGKVGFSLVCDNYMINSGKLENRVNNSFGGSFNRTTVPAEAGYAVDYSFNVPQYYTGMKVNVTLDGLVPQSGQNPNLELAGSTGSIKYYEFTPTQGTTSYTLKLQTANKTASICSLSLDTAADCYYEPVTSTLNQAMREFESLTVSNTRQGIGRPVTISFVMEANDQNYANKTIRVSLEGMKRKGSAAVENESFTLNTSNSDAFTINNRTITFNNIVTTTTAGALSVTISADDYQPKTATVTNRQLGQFTNVSLSPGKVATEADKDVTLTFNLSADDYYEGMTVNVVLDGLKPGDNSGLTQLTRAASTYTYQPNGSGTKTIALKTESASERECTAQLTASGFANSEVATVKQSAANHVLKASNTGSNDRNNVYDVQAVYQMEKLTSGQKYKIVFHAKADAEISQGNFSIFLKINGSDTQLQLDNQGPVTTSWKKWVINLPNNQNQNQINNAFDMLCFNLGKVVPGNAIYFDNVSLVQVDNNGNTIKEYVVNGDFEGSISDGFLSSEENKFDGTNKAAPIGTWWIKQNTGANPKPDCTLQIVESTDVE